jgi:hypothetical protein
MIGDMKLKASPPCSPVWRRIVLALLVAVVPGLAACAGSKVSSLGAGSSSGAVAVIALAPGGGILTDAVGVELAARGFQVIDSSQTSNLAMRIGLTEAEIVLPRGLQAFAAEGVDGILTVRSEVGYDRLPQSASARLTSTNGGRLVSGVTWQNGWGGQAGSIADRQMRKDLNEAANEIAEALSARSTPSKVRN